MGWDFDVIVVGGGPAGSSFALQLARLDPSLAARTLLLEKYTHPREKPCAGAISAFGMEALGAAGYVLDVPFLPLEGFRIRFGAQVCEHQRPGLGVVIRRDAFDHSLWRAAGAAGATLRDGQEVVGLTREGRGWRVQTRQGAYSARVLVAADGAGGRVRKLAGFQEPRKRGRLYVLETEPTAQESPESRTMEFDLGVISEGIEGYYWDFPVIMDGRPAVSRGIYHLNSVPRRDLKQVLCRFLERRDIDPGAVRFKPFSERGYVHGAEISRPGLLLVGEAAGIDPITGEGIAHALVYAQVAAGVVAEAFQSGHFHFEQYAPLVRSTLMARHLRQSAALVSRVYGGQGARWASFLVQHEKVVAACARWYEGRPLGARQWLDIAGAWLSGSVAPGRALVRA